MRKRLNILFVSEYFYPRLAGGEVWSWELCTALAQRHDVTVITTRIDGTREEERSKGVRILRPINAGGNRITRKISSVRLARYVERHLKKHKPDVVHVNAFTMNVPVSNAAKRLGIPCITAVHSYFGDDWRHLTPLWPLLKHLERSAILRDKSRTMHVPSEYLRKRIRKEIGKDTKVISNWLPDKFPPPKRFAQPTLLFVGSLEPVKNPLACVQVAKRLKMPLVVIGKGSLERALIDEAKKARIELILLGELKHKETLAYIRGASMVLVPSITESFSLVAAEAIAQGTPVAGNMVGALPELPDISSLDIQEMPRRLPRKDVEQVRSHFAKNAIIALIERLYD